MLHRRYLKKGSLLPKKQTKIPQEWNQIHRKTSSGRCRSIHSQFQRLEVLFNSFSSDQSVSARTTRRVLEKLGFHRRAVAKMLNLKAKVKRNRVKWCQRQRFWTAANGNRVLFSDDMLVKLRSDKRAYVCRPDGTQFAEKYIKGYTSDKRSLKFSGIISSIARKPQLNAVSAWKV